jgi:hypothetical protein
LNIIDLLTDIITTIVSNGLAVQKDVDIFKDYSPENPDTCIIVYEYNGSPIGIFTDLSVRSVQIVVRNKIGQEAKKLADQVLKLFNPETGIMLIQSRTCVIANRNTPIKIGVDEHDRKLYAFNLGITTNLD